MKNKIFVYHTHIFLINTLYQGNEGMLKKNDLHDIWQPGSDMKSLSTKKLENIIMYCKQIVIGKSSNDKYIYSPLILL